MTVRSNEMSDIQAFTDDKFGEIRTLIKDGNTLFCGADVARALGYARPNDAVSAHCRYTAKHRIATNQGNEAEMSFIPEGDVYRLITRSKLPEAEKFERWVFDDVLPTIRKHGMWAREDILGNPDVLIAVATELKKERAERARLAKENEKLLPGATYYNELVDREHLTNLRETAKMFNVAERQFIAKLMADGYLYRNQRGELVPYNGKNKGLFEVKEFLNRGHAGIQTLVTVKGREHLLRTVMREGLWMRNTQGCYGSVQR